jgi:hypothetical protein
MSDMLRAAVVLAVVTALLSRLCVGSQDIYVKAIDGYSSGPA